MWWDRGWKVCVVSLYRMVEERNEWTTRWNNSRCWPGPIQEHENWIMNNAIIFGNLYIVKWLCVMSNANLWLQYIGERKKFKIPSLFMILHYPVMSCHMVFKMFTLLYIILYIYLFIILHYLLIVLFVINCIFMYLSKFLFLRLVPHWALPKSPW